MSNSPSFLGTGWAFPPHFDRDSRTAGLVSAAEDINQSLHILLNTSLGERVMRPDYGCNLTDYLFEPANITMLGFLKELVQTAILFHEPRIEVEKIDISEPGDFDLTEGRLIISVDYKLIGTNSRFNFVYDFYLKEASR